MRKKEFSLLSDLKEVPREIRQGFRAGLGDQDHVFDPHVSLVREEHLRFRTEDHTRLQHEFAVAQQERYFMDFRADVMPVPSRIIVPLEAQVIVISEFLRLVADEAVEFPELRDARDDLGEHMALRRL